LVEETDAEAAEGILRFALFKEVLRIQRRKRRKTNAGGRVGSDDETDEDEGSSDEEGAERNGHRREEVVEEERRRAQEKARRLEMQSQGPGQGRPATRASQQAPPQDGARGPQVPEEGGDADMEGEGLGEQGAAVEVTQER
jgi:DNA replication licensing factor MCM3